MYDWRTYQSLLKYIAMHTSFAQYALLAIQYIPISSNVKIDF